MFPGFDLYYADPAHPLTTARVEPLTTARVELDNLDPVSYTHLTLPTILLV